MQYSIVRCSEITSFHSLRLDAEYYHPSYLAIDNTISLKPSKKLSEITKKIDVGFVGSMTSHYREDGVALLQTKNIESFFVSDSETVKITPSFHNQLKKSQVVFEDILIARSGSFGKASIYLGDSVINSSDIIIIQANNINPYFLTTFLNSSLGVNQMIRFASGGLQGHVNLTILEELKIPTLKTEFQSLIENILKTSYGLKEKAKSLYQQAENLLLEELGLKDWKPKHQLSYVKNYSDTQHAERFDAEYFQPQYDEILNKISILESSHLLDLVEDYSTGYPYKSENYLDEGIPLIRISNIKKGKLDLTTAAYLSKDYSNVSKKDIAREGNILISLSGTIGSSALVEKELGRCCVNQRILSIKVKPSIDKNYLCLLLNSVIGELQLNRIGAGGVQTNISPKDVFNIQIPILKPEKQKEISLKIIDSKEKDKQSKSLLEIAKKAVEIAIESNEEKATKWIDQELEKLGVRLSGN